MRAASCLLVIALCLGAAVSAKLGGSILGVDHSLAVALKNAKTLFENHFIEGSKVEEQAVAFSASSQLILNDIFFQTSDDTAVELRDIHVVSAPKVSVTSANADLQYLNMAVEGTAGTIVIDGNYSVSSHSILKMLPAISEGTFRAVLESVSFNGRTGLRVAGDSLLTQNYDMHYSLQDMIITVQYYTATGPVKSQVSTRFIDTDLVAKFKTRLHHLMNKYLQKRFDQVLSEYSLSELLLDNDAVLSSFRSHARTSTANANEYVDEVLANLAETLQQAGAGTINVPAELHASFSQKILWVTWHGSFTATDCWAKDIATIKRTGDVSISYDGGVITVFGSLGLGDLQIGFDHYHAEFMDIGPSGTVKASVKSNSLFIKISVDLLHSATATLQDLNVEYIDDVDLDVTGLGILNWLVSLIATWVLGFFNDEVVSLVNQQLQQFASTSVSLVDASQYFY